MKDRRQPIALSQPAPTRRQTRERYLSSDLLKQDGSGGHIALDEKVFHARIELRLAEYQHTQLVLFVVRNRSLTTIIIAMIPPLWRRLMTPEVLAWNLDYASGEALKLARTLTPGAAFPHSRTCDRCAALCALQGIIPLSTSRLKK